MNPSRTALSLMLGCIVLSGCGTITGAPDALANLSGKHTYASFEGRYLDQPEVRAHRQLDVQHVENLRLSYDGRSLPANEVRQQNLVAIPPLQDYLDGIVQRLGRGWPGDLPPLKVGLVDSYAFGPSADPYGNLFVPLGMLENVASEDEIAAMLAHEMSHVLLRHHDRRKAFIQQKETVTQLATLAIMGATVADTRMDRLGDQVRFNQKNPAETGKTINRTLLYSALINSFSDNVWNTAWGRVQEDQADLLGADLLIRAGYAPRAASHSLQRLDDYQGKQTPLMTTFLQQRQLGLSSAANKLDVDGVLKEAQTFLNQGVLVGITTASDYLQRSHMSPAQRDKDLRQYLQREYRAERRAQVERSRWARLRDDPQVQAALDAYRDAYGANVALERKDMRGAQALVERALSSPVANQPGIRRAAFNLQLAQGNRRQAAATLQAIEDWHLASPELYELAISVRLNSGDPQGAQALIDQGERNFGSEEMFILQKINVARQLKDQPAQQRLGKKCLAYPSVKASCMELVPELKA
ncbi:M48 family metallopeptidase [Pseudomonas sp. EpS/L25]|uniref:M48 family metallopeptidase n=1 Tax=Pseudomonas sp. EpS/L25 TaxID=1749078 RepID=UPI0007442D03|nr:M48 family metallopeptidase [Pseudomonas sp. EpS/L25]KUM34029.1 peptidase M48 [Pseudomonas sp. EpS/L25]